MYFHWKLTVIQLFFWEIFDLLIYVPSIYVSCILAFVHFKDSQKVYQFHSLIWIVGSFFDRQNILYIPYRMCSRMMFSNIHNPANMMFHWRIIAVTSFSFSRCCRINRRFFYNGEETRRSPSSFSRLWFLIPTLSPTLIRPMLFLLQTCIWELSDENNIILQYLLQRGKFFRLFTKFEIPVTTKPIVIFLNLLYRKEVAVELPDSLFWELWVPFFQNLLD